MSLRYEMNISTFSKIPGSPLAYWAGKKFGDIYDNKKVEDIADVITGMTIGDNNKYLRFRICSHRNEILQDIANFIEKKYKATYSLSQDTRKLYELSISTTYAIPLLNDCYNLNSIHLDRKYQKYLEYKRNQETTTSM